MKNRFSTIVFILVLLGASGSVFCTETAEQPFIKKAAKKVKRAITSPKFFLSAAVVGVGIFAVAGWWYKNKKANANTVPGLNDLFRITERTNLIIEKGDITQCRTEAIVNAANEQLHGGAGVCGAIFKAAGTGDLQRACDCHPEHNTVRCPVGQARITDSFNLKSKGIKYIIHAVGPDCRVIEDKQQQDLLLAQSYRNSLLLADKHVIKSIAFPFISSAIYAFPKNRAARIALETVHEYSQTHKTPLESIHFVLFSEEDYSLFQKTYLELNTPVE